MTFLGRLWRRIWYWRHDYFATQPFNIFTMHGVWWCRVCGGEIRSEPVGSQVTVAESTCPRWRAGEQP